MDDVIYVLNDQCLKPQDLARLYTVIGWNCDGTRTISRIATILGSSFCYVSACVNGQLVGFGRILGDGFSGQILDLMTHPDHRRKGIATEIMKRLLKEASERLVGLHLIDGNKSEGRFYERFGFLAANSDTDLLMYWDPSAQTTEQDHTQSE